MKKFIVPGMIVLTIIVSVCLVGYGFLVVSGYETTMSLQNQEIRSIEQELNALEMEKEENKVDVKAALNTATKAGVEIAAYQSDFNHVTVSTDDDSIETLGAKAKAMRKYFGTYDGNATTPWYSGGESGYVWSFETTYSFSGNTVPVLWLCRTRAGKVLGYCTAEYNAEEDVFNNVKWADIVYSNSEQASTIDLPEGIDRDDIWKALLGKVDEYMPTPTPDTSMSPEPTSTPGGSDEGMPAHGGVFASPTPDVDDDTIVGYEDPQPAPSEAFIENHETEATE